MLWALSLAACSCFLSFAWALRGHFRTDGRMPLRMRCLSLLSAVTFLGLADRLWTGTPAADANIVAVTLFLLSDALFWWTVRTTRTDRLFVAHSPADARVLHVTGPYRLIRHPFYVSYILFWIGAAVAAGPILWLPCFILCAWYVVTARSEETDLAASVPVGYQTYRRRTGMLLPRFVRRIADPAAAAGLPLVTEPRDPSNAGR